MYRQVMVMSTKAMQCTIADPSFASDSSNSYLLIYSTSPLSVLIFLLMWKWEKDHKRIELMTIQTAMPPTRSTISSPMIFQTIITMVILPTGVLIKSLTSTDNSLQVAAMALPILSPTLAHFSICSTGGILAMASIFSFADF